MFHDQKKFVMNSLRDFIIKFGIVYLLFYGSLNLIAGIQSLQIFSFASMNFEQVIKLSSNDIDFDFG